MLLKNKPIIGMIHVPALPGTPNNSLSMESICDVCLQEAKIYVDAGINALMIENMHDIPYLNTAIGPEITTAMAVIGREIKKYAYSKPVGIQILAAANKEALAAANAAGLDFIRAEGFVFAHVADEGYIQSCAGELLRFRKSIGAENIAVFADIKKKHSSHAITSDLDITEIAKAADFFLADGVIITGSHTGEAPNITQIKNVKKTTALPIILGSGITLENIVSYFPLADAFIIGSHFKKNGFWKNSPASGRIKNFMAVVEKLKD